MADGAGVVLLAPNGRALFLKRSPEALDQPETWCWPGGGIDEGETYEEAARRELDEETGFRHSGPLEQIDDRDGFVTFVAEVPEEFEPRLNDEHTDAHWTEPSDLRLIGGRGGKEIHPGVMATIRERLLDGQEPRTWSGGMDIKLALDRDTVRDFTVDGRMNVALNPISKANVCPYFGREIPEHEAMGLDPDKVYMLLRDPEELAKAAATFNGVPLLLIHKPSTADDHPREVTIGTTGTDAVWEEPYLKNTLVIWDGEGIEAIESDEQKELSSGYRYRADMTPGEFNGEHYDGVMRDIVGNHVALVEEGRAGPDVVVGDAKPRELSMKIKTAALPSRKALLVQAAAAAVLGPRLAADAKPVDLGKVFEGVNRKNFKAMQPKIAQRLKLATDKKLAKDADLEDVIQFIDAISQVDDGDADQDEVVIDADLVPGAADPPDPEDTNKGVNGDEGEGGREALLAELKAKLDGETFAKVATALSPPGSANSPTGQDEDMDKDKPPAEDADCPPEKKPVTQGAMDAAINKAIETTREEAKRTREAENLCRPHVGELSLGMDSADAIYRHTLETVYPDRDFKALSGAALKTMVEMIPAAGKTTASPRLGLDAKKAKAFEERFPGADRIKTL